MPQFELLEHVHWPSACYMQRFNGKRQSQDWYDLSQCISGGGYESGRTLNLASGTTRNLCIRHHGR